MTGDSETFRQGARAYRNARDWAEQQRNEAIIRANEKANTVEAEVPAGDEASAGDATASPALSFVTAVSEKESYIMSQGSRTSLAEDSDGSEEPNSSSLCWIVRHLCRHLCRHLKSMVILSLVSRLVS